MSPESDSQAEAVFRMPMRARDRDCGQFEGAICAVRQGLAGIGDRLSSEPPDLDAAVAAAGTEHGEKAGRMLLRFAELPEGALVWTQTGDDSFRLGRIAGPWRYATSGCLESTGIHHVRPVRWMRRAFTVAETPPGVTETFARGGRNMQRINDRAAERASRDLWESEGDSGQDPG